MAADVQGINLVTQIEGKKSSYSDSLFMHTVAVMWLPEY